MGELNREQVEEIIRRRNEGTAVRTLAADFKVTTSAIYYRLDRYRKYGRKSLPPKGKRIRRVAGNGKGVRFEKTRKLESMVAGIIAREKQAGNPVPRDPAIAKEISDLLGREVKVYQITYIRRSSDLPRVGRKGRIKLEPVGVTTRGDDHVGEDEDRAEA